MEDTNWKQMGRKLIAYVIWCGEHQLVFEVCVSLGSRTHFYPISF
ncbi:hypothetical protein FB440_10180 [Vibrio crassostreae]|nr:hypothetical protein FB440_10180 [Vibrio crassostreae]